MRLNKLAITASAVGLTLIMGGCSGTTTPAGSTSASNQAPAGKVDLTVATFNEFGYDNLYAEYEAANPGVKITPKKAGKSDDAHTNIVTRLAAGGDGLSDIEAVDGDWLPEIKQSADKFADLKSGDVAGRWVDFVQKQATTDTGALIGYGTDIGPEATCYRKDLFEKAGFPSDRESVKAQLEGDWNHYFDVGKQFVAKVPNVGWFDSAGAIVNARVQQLPNPYSSTADKETVIPLESNSAVKAIYDSTLAASVNDKLSAHLGQWSPDWQAGFQKGSFATMQCPAWMLGVIEGNAAGVTNWDVASVFPGGGGNWGGSYLTVPKAGKNVAAAQKLAAWLTAPEQQIKAFKLKGTFPSQVKAYESADLKAATNKFFNNAPTGAIFTERAQAVKSQPYKGEHYFAINTAVGKAVGRVDIDKTDAAEASWAKAVAEAKTLK